MNPLIRVISEPPAPIVDTGQGWPLLRLGFRPFYLGAAVFAALAVRAWVLLFLGHMDAVQVLSPLLWHAHEMLFGFAAAVIVGFLLTAGKAWTGMQTPRGPALAALVLVWLAARVAAWMAPYPVYAALDLLLLWVFSPSSAISAPLLALAAVMQLARLAAWKPWRTGSRPILWILHLSYAWIPVGFLLLAMSLLGWIAASTGIHALAVGATGGLIIGMVTRTARGHTGRPLQVSPVEVAAYSLVMLAAVLRVFVPLLAPQFLVASVITATLAWSLAFFLYLARYTPWLLRARLEILFRAKVSPWILRQGPRNFSYRGNTDAGVSVPDAVFAQTRGDGRMRGAQPVRQFAGRRVLRIQLLQQRFLQTSDGLVQAANLLGTHADRGHVDTGQFQVGRVDDRCLAQGGRAKHHVL